MNVEQPLNAETPDRVNLPIAVDAPADPPASRRAALTPADQKCVASLVTLALVAIGFSTVRSGGDHVALVDLSRPVVLANDQRMKVGFQLDLNRADWPEWTLLPRIGETLARRIVDSRSKEGLFATPDDLRRVSGIGPKTLANIRPYLLPRAPAASVQPDREDRF